MSKPGSSSSWAWASRAWDSWGWRTALGIAVALGVGLRIHNAIHYPIGWGFDDEESWRRITALMRSGPLPSPEVSQEIAGAPLFFQICAALCRALQPADMSEGFVAIRLFSAGIGLLGVALVVSLVRRMAPEAPRRAWLAGALLLFLPVHITSSVLLTGDLLAGVLASFAITAVAWELASPEEPRFPLARAFAIGAVAGSAWLANPLGGLVIVAVATSFALAAWHRGRLARAGPRLAVLLLAALLVCAGLLIPGSGQQDTVAPDAPAPPAVTRDMPPGERHLGDYLRFPLATFVDPQLMNPDLLRSVWGGTYVTIHFDGHRHFLPRRNRHVRRAGTLLLLLALLPTAAFLVGAARGLRRSLRAPRSPDTPLLLLTAITLVGYVLFTWRNPWFIAVKGSALLGLAIPYGVYASEVLSGWMEGSRGRAALIGTSLLALWLGSALVFTFHDHLWSWQIETIYGPGLRWVDPGRP